MDIEDFRDIIVEKLEAEAKKAREDLNGIYTGLKLAIDIINEEYDNIPEMSEEEFVKRLNSHHEDNYNGFYDDDDDYDFDEDEEDECYVNCDDDLDSLIDYPEGFKTEWIRTYVRDILPESCGEFCKRLTLYGYHTIADLMYDFNTHTQYNFVDFKSIKERIGTVYSTAYDWYRLNKELVKRDISVINKDIYNINYDAVEPSATSRDLDISDILAENISPRIRNALYRAGFKSMADLQIMGPVGNLINYKDIGKKSMTQIAMLMDKLFNGRKG